MNLWQRIQSLFGRKHFERDLDEELRFHVEAQTEANIRAGMTPQEARRRAMIELGGIEQTKEQVRGVRWGHFVETLWQDVRYGARMLGKNPGFTLVAVLTLALGIGANTAIFQYVNALLLRPLNLPEPDRLVRVYGTSERGRKFDVFSYPAYCDLRDRTGVFSGLAAHTFISVSFSTRQSPENAVGELVSGSYFNVLGVQPALGRMLLPSDDLVPGAHPVVVISDGFWRRRFGADAGVVGQTVHLNGYPFAVVGVAPAEFHGTYESLAGEIWVPLAMHEQVRPRGTERANRNWGWLFATGRLKAGVKLEQARAEASRVAAQLSQEHAEDRGQGFNLFVASALPEQYREGAVRILGLFAGVVALVLLVTCANLAGMFLARMTSRRQEIAVRLSLGASRARLVRQWLTESVLLSLGAGIVSVAVALWVRDALLWMRPSTDVWGHFAPAIGLEGRVVAWTVLLALVAGVICGLLPALRAGGTNLVSVLKDEAASGVGGRRRFRLQGWLLGTQVAICMLVLVASGLMLRTLRNARDLDPGFRTEGLVLMQLDLRRNHYDAERTRAFYAQLSERMRGYPGVRGFSMASIVPLEGGMDKSGLRIEGYQPPDGKQLVSIAYNVVGADYFSTMEIPVLQGRPLQAEDMAPNARGVAVVNQTMARQYWPAGNALGRTIQLGTTGPVLEVVGVAADVKYAALAEAPIPYAYFPASRSSGQLFLHLRASGSPDAALAALRSEVTALDPNIAPLQALTFEEMRRVALFPQRALAAVTGTFGVLALLLTATGLYGLVAYSVAQRTREIGLRMALGAQRGQIARMVVGQGLGCALAGIAVGAGIALGMMRYLSGMLLGVTPSDALTYIGVAVFVALAAVAACYLPARRATRVDPMVALRYE